GASERRLINKINTMIGTEPEEADVTHVVDRSKGAIFWKRRAIGEARRFAFGQ
ncbi:unnamed protein product, partial [Ascophyllum nodosum]